MHENREGPESAPPSGPVGKGLWRMTPTPPSPRGAATGRSEIGIVPVNPPNKAHQPAAEAGEGRPVTEDGQWTETTVGTPQGAVLSPLPANVFLHYVLDPWVQQWRKTQAQGDVIIVRYADDFVMGFQCPGDAKNFLKALRERLEEYKLKLHPDTTRLIECGRFAQRDRAQRGERKPETFDFLGFTHWCGATRKNGRFTIGRKPAAQRIRKTLKAIQDTLMRRRHRPVQEQGRWVRSVPTGYFAYFAAPGTAEILSAFRTHVSRGWLWAQRRRSQRKGRKLTWKRFERIMDTWIPKVQIMHPYPNQRLIVNPR